MSIASVVHGLAVTLGDNIEGLRCFDHQPEQINPPTAICAVTGVNYGEDMSGEFSVDLGVIVLVSRADARTAQQTVYDYLDNTGSKSIADTINTYPTLGGVVTDCDTVSAGGPSLFTIGGQDYIGVEFNLHALCE